MSKVVEYVGVLHVLKDHAKETWTQFRASFSSSSAGVESCTSNENNEINFRSRVKEKLERLRQRSIQVIDSTSNDQEDYSHLTRPKTRRELMQISAAVMGIEFSYAAETAFVSPLLLNIGLRHRHMTLIWCLSPLLGFFLTPILGSLSDGCKSQLGRRRPFIILLSIGIVFGLIMVPNGKTLGRMLGDTYSDDSEPVYLNTHSELTSRLLIAPNLSRPVVELSTVNPTDIPTTTDLPQSDRTVGILRDSRLPSREDFSSQETKLAYKAHSSKYNPTEEEHGFRAWNSLSRKDEDVDKKEFFKSLGRTDKSQKINQQELRDLLFQATQDVDDEETLEKSEESEEESKLKKNRVDEDGQDLGWNKRTHNETTSLSTSERMSQSKSLGTTKTNESASHGVFDSGSEDAVKSHPWGLVFTVIGTVLLDFDADACQSPSRAYMLDITIPEDHAKGLSTFTIMAGLGGTVGYFLGALNWENTFLGNMFGGQVRAVFTLVLFIFIACVVVTVRSFREIPMDRLWANKSGEAGLCGTASGMPELKPKPNSQVNRTYTRLEGDIEELCIPANDERASAQKSYGTVQETSFNDTPKTNQNLSNATNSSDVEQAPTFREYVKTIVQLPHSLRWLCVTNFFCWMSLVCYSLYFTDFVGEAVFEGDPTAPRGSPLKEKYDEGVRFGCWGMSLYSLSCSLYSLCIETLVSRFGARNVYIYGQLVYSVGMVLMALARHPAGVIIFSCTAGIMYATLFTMPYLLVARYHAAETFDIDVDDLKPCKFLKRGLGTDVALVSSVVFLAQITQALTLGSIVAAVGSTTAIVWAASVFAACGAVCATKVLYLDL